MEKLLLLLIIGALIAFVIYLWRPNRPSSPHAAPPPPPPPQDPFAQTHDLQGDPRSLKAGDMLDFGVERTWIRGTLRLSEGGYAWAEHFLEIPEGKRWLSVEADPDVQMAMWTGRPELDLTPYSDTIDFEGARYRMVERGSAAYRSEGTTGLPAQGGMDYVDYEAPDGSHLAFERFDHGRWEVAIGTTVPNGSFTIYPGG